MSDAVLAEEETRGDPIARALYEAVKATLIANGVAHGQAQAVPLPEGGWVVVARPTGFVTKDGGPFQGGGGTFGGGGASGTW